MRKLNKITVDIFFDFSNPYSYIGTRIFRYARDIYQKSHPDLKIITLFHSTPTLPAFQQTSMVSTLMKTYPEEFSELEELKKTGNNFGCPITKWTYHANSFPAFLLLKAANQNIKENVLDDIFNSVFVEGENISDYQLLNIIAHKYKITSWGWNTIENVIGQYDVSKKHYKLKDYPRFIFDGKINLYGILSIEVFLDNFKKCTLKFQK